MPDKPLKHAIAYVIYNDDRSKFYVVQRPDDDESLPNVWGLPAGSVKTDKGESFEDAVLRSGKQKLGVDLKIVKYIGEKTLEREEYSLHLKNYECEIVEGNPSVPQSVEGVTQYQGLRWGTADDLVEAASKGSLCCQIYLESVGRRW